MLAEAKPHCEAALRDLDAAGYDRSAKETARVLDEVRAAPAR